MLAIAYFNVNVISIEKVLVGWTGIPSRDTLNKLPSTPR